MLRRSHRPDRLSGIFHPEYRLGIVLAAFLPLYLELVRRVVKRTWVGWLLVLPIIIVTLLSGSRSGWIMGLLGLILYTMYLARVIGLRRFVSARSALAIALLVLITAIAVNHFPATAKRASDAMNLFSGELDAIDAATKRRISIWIPALEIAQSNWFNGVGPRSFRYQFVQSADADNFWMKRDPPGVTHPHMHALEVMTETGVIGVIGYIAFFVLLIRLLRRQPAGPGTLTPLVVCVLVAMFPFNVHMALYGSFWSSVCWWLIFLSLATSRESKPTKTESPESD